MLALFYLVCGALVAMATVATLYSISHAELGYEDELGFHFAGESHERRPVKFVTHVRVTTKQRDASEVSRGAHREEEHDHPAGVM